MNGRLPKGHTKYIHVSPAVVKRNAASGRNDPAIIVRSGAHSYHCSAVEIIGDAEVVQNMKNPIGGTARVWIQTTGEVLVQTNTIYPDQLAPDADQLEVAEKEAELRILRRRLGDADVRYSKSRELLETYLRAVPFDSIREAFPDADMAELYLKDLGLV